MSDTESTELATEDYFRSGRLIRDPYAFWDDLRGHSVRRIRTFE